jgi:hypothetical protein
MDEEASHFQWVAGLRKELYEDDQFRTHDAILVFHDHLKAKYGQAVFACRLYHLIAGSTVTGTIDRFDFRGADSIERFIEQLHAERFTHAAPREKHAAAV